MAIRRIIIVGGGFAGVKCAHTLRRKFNPDQLELILFNRENHMVFSPLLAEVVGSSINSLDIVVPLRQLLEGVFCRTEEVLNIVPGENAIEYRAENQMTARMSYDHLVLACGNVTNMNVVPGMADHGFPLKTVADATSLRSHLIGQMERAEVTPDPDRKRWLLTTYIVGGGYSGVEAAGEINDLFRASARYYRHWTLQDLRVVLVHSGADILPEISPGLRQFAQRKMEQAGVSFVLNTRVSGASPDGISLPNGQLLSGSTIVTTVGSSPAPLILKLAFPKTKGRLNTSPDMRLPDHPNIWAVGDCAAVLNAQTNSLSPTTGQFAERQGRQCAQNIQRVLRQQPTRPFRFKQIGELCSIGGHSAVADLLGLHLSGFLAWFAWRGVYLFKLPTLGRRFQVGFDWATLLIFPRDLAHTRADHTERISHAHYHPGEFVFRKGEAPSYFYVLEKGEVEVLKDGEGSEIVAVLGPNSFFGERALLNDRPRLMSVRARTDAEVLILGKEVLTQISGALAPFLEALAKTLTRRMSDFWKQHPAVRNLLEASRVSQLMDPVPEPLLSPDLDMTTTSKAFTEHGNEFFYVSRDHVTLDGLVTISDLLRTETGETRGMHLKEFMTAHPVTVSPEDTCLIAANLLREYRLKNLPVVEPATRRLRGCLRARRLIAFVLSRTSAPNSGSPLPAGSIERK